MPVDDSPSPAGLTAAGLTAAGLSATGLTAAGLSATGLTTAEAAERLNRYGRNELHRTQRIHWWVRVGAALKEPLVMVLLAAAGLTILTGDLPDTTVILVVVIVNTTVAIWQQVRAERAITALSSLRTPQCPVIRDGIEVLLDSALVVPGDVLTVAEGDVVPADGTITDAVAVQVDESTLTGESIPVEKATRDQVHAGSTVVHGRATIVVTGTGDASALGQIAALMTSANVRTPLQLRLAQLSKILAVVTIALCLLVMLIGLVRGEPVQLMVLTAISLVVAAVPESLPVVVTLSLALGARRMARGRAVVRDLAAVETLGSVTLLATDKTGTLTEGRMSVAATWHPDGSSTRELLSAAALCNDARSNHGAHSNHNNSHDSHNSHDSQTHLGDPTEVALLVGAMRAGIDPTGLRESLPRIGELPFDSQRRRMTTLHRQTDGSTLIICKGAPEALLQKGILQIADAELTTALQHSSRLAQTGARVLAVASRHRSPINSAVENSAVENSAVENSAVENSAVENSAVENSAQPPAPSPPGGDHPGDPDEWEAMLQLRLLGLVALNDPPRASSRATIQACGRAGIRVVMVTGDGPQTAAAVAEAVGIDTDSASACVLSRVTPASKLAAVQRWQRHGEVVAMTGDGVNDGPALRQADIGVAMGRRGTDVARQAADLVLADDELGTVVKAIEEGRRVYANIRRFLLYGLSGGAAEVLVMLGGPLVGLGLPLLPAQILWVNLLTHSLAGTALGAEPAEPGLLDRPPRDPSEGVLGAGLWWRVLLLAVGMTVLTLASGRLVAGNMLTGDPRSTMLLVLGAGQLGIAMGARARTASDVVVRERNWSLPGSVAVAAALLVAAVQLDPLPRLLSTGPVSAAAGGLAISSFLAGWLGGRIATGRRV